MIVHWTSAKHPLEHELVPPPFRRLTDKILVVFHHACDAGELDVATYLLRLLEMMAYGSLPPPSGERRMEVVPLVDANERLWQLRDAERRLVVPGPGDEFVPVALR